MISRVVTRESYGSGHRGLVAGPAEGQLAFVLGRCLLVGVPFAVRRFKAAGSSGRCRRSLCVAAALRRLERLMLTHSLCASQESGEFLQDLWMGGLGPCAQRVAQLGCADSDAKVCLHTPRRIVHTVRLREP